MCILDAVQAITSIPMPEKYVKFTRSSGMKWDGVITSVAGQYIGEKKFYICAYVEFKNETGELSYKLIHIINFPTIMLELCTEYSKRFKLESPIVIDNVNAVVTFI